MNLPGWGMAFCCIILKNSIIIGKKKHMKSMIAGLFLLVICTTGLAQTKTPSTWSKKDADKWFTQYEWLHGVKLTPHRSIDREEFARLYHLHPERWDKAFGYLKNTDMASLKPGRYQVWGDSVYVTVTENASKDSSLTKWESHQNYADIHLMITGKELIGVGPVKGTANVVPYDATKDVGFWDVKGKFYEADPKTFFIFFPNLNAHRPSNKLPDGGQEKKLVIKVLTEK